MQRRWEEWAPAGPPQEEITPTESFQWLRLSRPALYSKTPNEARFPITVANRPTVNRIGPAPVSRDCVRLGDFRPQDGMEREIVGSDSAPLFSLL